MKISLSTAFLLSMLTMSADVDANTLTSEWAIDNNYEIYFRGSVGQCKQQEILTGKPAPSSELESLQKYYFTLLENDTNDIVALYSDDDGSKQRVEQELLEDASKFDAFKGIKSVKATCFNIWGQYYFFDVLLENQYKWMDVQYCGDNSCKTSDFFLTADAHSQLHSTITAQLLLNKPVSTNLKKSKNFELEFYPPSGSKKNELVVAMNVSSNLGESEITELESFLTSLTSLIKYKNSNETISQQARELFDLDGNETIDEVDTLLANYLPPSGLYQSYILANSEYALNPHISFLFNFLTNDFKPVASIQLTSTKKLFLLISKNSVIFVERTESNEGKPSYNFSFSDRAFESLIGNSLFVSEFLKKINVNN